MALTQAQKDQVAMQLKKHQRETLTTSVLLDKGISIDLVVEHGVFGSDMMSSGIYLARFLYAHKILYTGKSCLDMGCGPGLQGLIMAIYGARSVDFSDINSAAVENSRRNILLHKLQKKCQVFVSDLFAQMPAEKQYDIIVFNHPFFPEEAGRFGEEIIDDAMLRKSMLGGTELIKTFFKEAKWHLKNKESIIIMPYFHFAGTENDPATHANSYGFTIIQKEKILSQQGLQRGEISIYIIKKTIP